MSLDLYTHMLESPYTCNIDRNIEIINTAYTHTQNKT